jgi:hypothetical protein
MNDFLMVSCTNHSLNDKKVSMLVLERVPCLLEQEPDDLQHDDDLQRAKPRPHYSRSAGA